ncbi:MAG: PilC/PilY family type IV pilus protein [Desulfobacterales bacterium]
MNPESITRRRAVAALLLAVACLCVPSPADAVERTFEVRLTGSANDAKEGPLGIMDLNESVLEIGGLYRRIGLRFTGVDIPKNAGITRAYIEFTVAGSDSSNTTLTIEAQAADNPVEFTATLMDIRNRVTYADSVDWYVNYPWQTEDAVHQSAEIKDLVQKIVNRSGWAAGNAMVFVITNGEEIYRRAKSWDLDPNKAPKLHIEYTANIIEVPIIASSDDIYQYYYSSTTGGYPIYNSHTFQMAGSVYNYPALRFQNVDIPQGAVINYACFRFTAKQDRAAETGYFRIFGEKRLNPPTFATGGSATNPDFPYRRRNYSPPAKTTNYATWSGFPAWVTDQVYNSVDIKSVVQEIVGQPGWDTSDKSMAFLLSPMGGSPARYAWSFDGDPAKAPVLYIEYGQLDGGGYSSPAVMLVSTSELGRSCFEGSTAEGHTFALINSGGSAMNYTRTVTFTKGTDWLSVYPTAASGSLGAGEEQNFTVNFNTTGLASGTYEAFITFTDPSATPTEKVVRVSLSVMKEGTISCGDIPLYTQNISSPAVMILLDLSGSMTWEVDLVNETDVLPETPNLSPVVQEIVNREGWAPGNAITFIVEKVSGTDYRRARSYDGFNPSKPVLTLSYDDGSGVKSFETSIMRSTDDGDVYSAIPWNPTGGSLLFAQGGNCYGAALRFDGLSIPKGATITDTRIRFVPYETRSGPITVKIRAHASDNSPTFSTAATWQLCDSGRPRTLAQVDWAMEPWTGVTIETKIDVAKTVISELVKDTSISWGFGSWAAAVSPYVVANDYTAIHVGCNPHTADHQARLQAAVAGVTTYSSTPFSPSILAGKKYFAKEKGEWDLVAMAEVGAKFEEAECQPKFLIQITDGQGNVDSTNENVMERTHLLADQGVTPVGIGFGVPQGEQEQIYAFADVANTRGKAQDDDTIYAMHPEDETGKAIPYIATSKDELMEAFRTIMSNVKGAVFYGSAPAATTSTDLGDTVILSSFNAGNWTGNVQAISKVAGAWNSILWEAKDRVPADRSVWTVNSSGNTVAYSDGTLPGDNWLCKEIGDIINSTPVVVGEPPYFHRFNGYADFKRQHSVTTPRAKTIYVGSNDGLLHAFNLADGSEKWAFLPPSLHPRLNTATTNPLTDPCSDSYCHQYLLDGSPQVADVYATFGGGSAKWRTLLVVGQRQGGTAYTALDVTSGNSPNPSGSDPAKFLWELTDVDLGESWADALIERVAYPEGGESASAWGVFVSSGYAANRNNQFSKEAFLYGVQADTGAGLWQEGQNTVNKIKLVSEKRRLDYKNLSTSYFVPGETVTGASSGATAKVVSVVVNADPTGTLYVTNSQGTFQNSETLTGSLGHSAQVNGVLQLVEAGQPNNAASSPVTANFNPADNKEDCAYVGDLYGTMFRVDNIGRGQTPSVSRLFKFDPYPTTPDMTPIRGKASTAYSDLADTIWVYYGTGRYETAADKINITTQYFFGLKDQATPRQTALKVADLTALEARFVTATIGGVSRTVRTIAGTNNNANSWALKLYSGQSGWGGPATLGGSERVFTKPLVVGGIVFFTTFIPDADQCTGSGETWVFAVDYKTGLPPTKPVFDLNGDGMFTDADKVAVGETKVVPVGIYVGRGVGSQPVLHKDTLFVTTSSPQYQLGAPGGGNATGLNAMQVNIPQNRIRVESWKHN